jgi:hypothetical protein
MMDFENEIRLTRADTTVATITKCEIYAGTRTLVGHEVTFGFRIVPTLSAREKSLALKQLTIDIYLKEQGVRLLIGRFNSRNQGPINLRAEYRDEQQQLHLRADEWLRLIELTHHSDVRFEFDATAEIDNPGQQAPVAMGQGTLRIPHSQWLEIVNRIGAERFEIILLRLPTETSLKQPFAAAVEKIREAESFFMKGNWNAVGAACRAAFRTVLSATPPNTPAIEHLLQPVVNDPRRYPFAQALTKGLLNILNESTHLEGDTKTNTPPASLSRADSLLCLHWYSTVIAYLAEIHD